MNPLRHLSATLAIAASVAAATLGLVGVTPAAAATCVVVPNPTPTNHMECAGMDLAHLILENKNLSYADFSGAWLGYSSLLRSNLHGATFDGAQVWEGNLSGADLTDASFRYTSVDHTPLTWSDASRADFTGASMEYSGMDDTNFTDADLTDASLQHRHLTELTTFAGATLTRTDFSRTVVRIATVDVPFVPPDQSVRATAPAGKVVTWAPPISLPGATAGTCDHESGSVFAPGTTTVRCPVLDDHGNEGFATFDIVVTPAVPKMVPGAATVTEGGPGSEATVRVPVTLSFPSDLTVTASWTTVVVPGAPGSQAGGDDYVPASGTVTFAPGETAKTVPITIVGDRTVEGDEYIVTWFHDATNAVPGGFMGLGFGVIANDDATVVVPGAGSVVEGDGQSVSVEVPVTLTNPSSFPVTVRWDTIHPTDAPGAQADPATDYDPASGTVTFAPGETTQHVSISVHGDIEVEPDEYLVVAFHHPSGAAIGGFWGLGFGTIVNDD